MSVSYVTVKVDTSGLYQPVANAVGVVGLIGPAPSAGPGYANPAVFTRALTGANTEPYARVIAVIRTTPDATGKPVDANNAAIPNVGWNAPTDSKGNPIGLSVLTDTSAAVFTPLTVDVGTRTLRYASGAAFQNGAAPAAIVIDYFSIAAKTLTAAAPYYGVPLDINDQPIPNLIMKPDANPATAFEDFTGTALTIDGTLGVAGPGSGKPMRAGGSIVYTVVFSLCPLAQSINLALTNGALSVWAYRLDTWQGFDSTSPAFTDFSNRAIDIVALSATSDPNSITALRTHVEAASPNDAGGGGIRPRIGVAMLPEGGITNAAGTLTNNFSDWTVGGNPSPMTWSSSRMVFVAANSPDDVASAAAGVIAGVDPWVSLILKPVTGVGSTGTFTDTALLTYLTPENAGLTQPHVDPIFHPDFLAGSGLVMGEGYSADGTGQRLYIDIVRTIDDLSFKVKALLTSPQVIGTLRINRPGLRILTAMLAGLLSGCVTAGEIDDFAIDIPIQAIVEKDPANRSAAETAELEALQNSRLLPLNVSITYAGAIHYLVITLKFV